MGAYNPADRFVLNAGVQEIDMDDAAHALIVSGTAASAETLLTSRVLYVDPASSGVAEVLTLPPEADWTRGALLFIFNSGGEDIEVVDDAAGAVVTVPAGKMGIFTCDGTTWRGTTTADATIDVENALTGTAAIKLGDNLANAFEFKEGANSYLRFITTNGAERMLASVYSSIGSFTTGAETTAGVLFAITHDTWSDYQLSIFEVHGASASDLGSSYCAKCGRFRHVVNIGTHGDCAHETYGLMAQLVAREVTFKHLHAGLIGTLEGHTGGVISNGAYTYSVAAVMARVGGGAYITATKPVSGFTAFWNGAALASGDSIAYSACASSTVPWKYGFIFPRGGVAIGGLIGSFAGSAATTGGILFSTAQDIWGDKQLSTFEVHGASNADLGGSYCAKVGRFRHIVNVSGAVGHETYGFMGQLVVKDSVLGHLHGGIIGTFEGHTSGVECDATVGGYTLTHACVIARLGGHAAITATTPVCGFLAWNNGIAALAGGSSVAFGASVRSTSYQWTYGLYLETGAVANGIEIGNSTTGLTLATYVNHGIAVYTTSASADGGHSVQPIYMKSTMTGAGGVGGRACFHMTTGVALGDWANALKGYAEFTAGGRITGLASAVVAEMKLPNENLGSGGAYAPLEVELVYAGNAVVSAGAPTGNHVAFAKYVFSGDPDGDFDDNGFFFTVNGLTAAATVHMFRTGLTGATVVSHMTAAIRVAIEGVTYFIPLATATA